MYLIAKSITNIAFYLNDNIYFKLFNTQIMFINKKKKKNEFFKIYTIIRC